jgi:hypothetical protein
MASRPVAHVPGPEARAVDAGAVVLVLDVVVVVVVVVGVEAVVDDD